MGLSPLYHVSCRTIVSVIAISLVNWVSVCFKWNNMPTSCTLTCAPGYEIHGMEKIPDKGPALIVYYHGAIPIDYYYFLANVIIQKGRPCHSVADHFLFKVPGIHTVPHMHTHTFMHTLLIFTSAADLIICLLYVLVYFLFCQSYKSTVLCS